IQIWRRVDSLQFEPGECQTGMPEGKGYQLIKLVPAGTTTYTDQNLAAGAVYCYRLVATFPLPEGGESRVSEEVCVPPIPASAPIVTNVSVDSTTTNLGKIAVRWVKPFDVDTN